MKLSSNNSNAPTVEAGLYSAVCYGLIDLGVQTNDYQGKVSYQRKALIKFELLDEFDSEDRRIVLSQIYNMSLNEMAKFRKHLKSWRGKDFNEEELSNFEPKTILGTNVILNVVIHDKTGRAIIDSMAKYKDEPAQSKRPQEYFSIDEFDGGLLPDFISEGVANIIHKSKEWACMVDGGMVDSVNHAEKEEIPF